MGPARTHPRHPRSDPAGEGRGNEARFELRHFGARLDRVRARMRRCGRERGASRARKLYLLGPRDDVNLKIRDGRLEVKRLVERQRALQRWRVEAVQPLPLEPAWARRWLPALLGVPALAAGDDETQVDLRTLVLRALRVSPRVDIVSVTEERERFDLGGGVCGEHGRARVGGLPVETVAVEGANPAAVRRAALRLGMDPTDNTSWPAALRALAVAPEGLGRPDGDGDGCPLGPG